MPNRRTERPDLGGVVSLSPPGRRSYAQPACLRYARSAQNRVCGLDSMAWHRVRACRQGWRHQAVGDERLLMADLEHATEARLLEEERLEEAPQNAVSAPHIGLQCLQYPRQLTLHSCDLEELNDRDVASAAGSALHRDCRLPLHNCHPTSILKCRNELEDPVPQPVAWQNADCVVFQRDDLVWLHERQSLFKLATHLSSFRGNESACVGDFEGPSMSPWS